MCAVPRIRIHFHYISRSKVEEEGASAEKKPTTEPNPLPGFPSHVFIYYFPFADFNLWKEKKVAGTLWDTNGLYLVLSFREVDFGFKESA